jgi:hypothetical protein
LKAPAANIKGKEKKQHREVKTEKKEKGKEKK